MARGITAAISAAASILILTGCVAADTTTAGPTTAEPPPDPVRFPRPSPVTASVSSDSTSFSESADVGWLAATAEATGIPERALRSYAAATIVSNRENAECAVSWNTLAGIGAIESDHGAIFGGRLDAAGTVSPPVFGIPLDGIETADIPDSDDGAIDGDPTVDRAVGPMQLIPDTWRNWHVDAGGDGVEDPQNLDDAALAAVHYLCRAGGDLSAEEGWSAAILAWNRSEEYLLDVAATADGYADATEP